MRLFTDDQLQKAFEAGERKSLYPLAKPGFIEWQKTITPIVVTPESLETAKMDTAIGRLGGRRPLTVRAILSAITKATHTLSGINGVAYHELVEPSETGKKGEERLTHPRMIGFYMCFIHTDSTYRGVGRLFGNRTHATVMNGVKNIVAWRENDPKIAALLHETYSILKGQGYAYPIHPRKINQFND